MTKHLIDFRKFYVALSLVLIIHNLNAQDTTDIKRSQYVIGDEIRKQYVHLELGGRTFLMGSFNYEYLISEQFAIGCGLGIINFQRGEISRNNNGATETGKYLDISTSQMIYGNYFIGKDNHKLYFTVGISNFLFTNRNTYVKETEISRETELEFNTGIGYQFTSNKIYFRFTGYWISLAESTEWFPKYLPWVGISTGIKF